MRIKVEDLVAVLNQIRFDVGSKYIDLQLKEHSMESGQLCDVLCVLTEDITKEKYDGSKYTITNRFEIFGHMENVNPTHVTVSTCSLKTKD
jgi:hypothetical protein